jgi:hypothetical protein
MHYLSSFYWITTHLHVSGPFVVHHQDTASACVANGICFSSKWSVGGPGWKGTAVPFHPDKQCIVLVCFTNTLRDSRSTKHKITDFSAENLGSTFSFQKAKDFFDFPSNFKRLTCSDWGVAEKLTLGPFEKYTKLVTNSHMSVTVH